MAEYGEALTEDGLAAIVASQIKGALGYDADQLSNSRADAIARYEGEPYGDERDGRSQVMDRSVMETVEAIMPSLVRTFLGSEDVVAFEPQGPEDEEYADQATDLVNYALMRDNPGYRIAYDWMKSSLISGSSVCKLWWDETDETKTENYSGLNDAELNDLVNDDSVEVLEHTAYAEANGQLVEPGDAMAMAGMGAQVQPVHDVKIKHTITKKRLRWEAVPPEEFLINRRARSLDEYDSTLTFCCHRQGRTVEELIAEGYDRDKVLAAGEHDDWYLDESEERFDDLEYSDANDADTDPSQRVVWVYECYLRTDYDGDGIAELRRVTVLGGATSTVVLDNEPVEEIPFADICPIRLPHRFYGWSLTDLSKDLQRLKTALWRAQMDGLYLSLYPHKAVNEDVVELDDLLSEDPGSIYRVHGDPGSAIIPVQTQWTGAQAFPMMQYVDQLLASRTGVNQLSGGLDANVLQNETARAVDEAANSAKARVELIVRSMAETGWTRVMKLALKMIHRHQDKSRTVRLRGDFVSVDPRAWNVDMDVRINVGLGIGTKSEQMMKYNMIAQKQEALMAQMGPNNPIAPLNLYYNTMAKIVEAADLNVGQHFQDPTEAMQQQAQQPPQPDPEMMKAQAELQMKQQESQARLQQSQAEAQMRAQSDQQRAQMDAEVARFKAELEAQQARESAELKAAVDREVATNKLALERDKMNLEHQYRMQELAEEKALEREKMAAGSRDGQGNINVSD